MAGSLDLEAHREFRFQGFGKRDRNKTGHQASRRTHLTYWQTGRQMDKHMLL